MPSSASDGSTPGGSTSGGSTSGGSTSGGPILCPSSDPKPGLLLLGVIGPNGRTAYVPTRTPVTGALQELADDPEAGRTYRFASPCMTRGCVFWGNDRCHVQDAVRHDRAVDGLADPEVPAELPACSIRASCRWWRQDGPAACGLCPLVVTRATGQRGDP